MTCAVFRVLSIVERLETFEFNLKPMNRKSGAAFPENVPFWRYTPGGDLLVAIEKPARPALAVGEFVRVQFNQDPEGAWLFRRVTRSAWQGSGDGEGSVEFSAAAHKLPGFGAIQHGTCSMDLSGEGAPIQSFGAVGSRWRIELSRVAPAETE